MRGSVVASAAVAALVGFGGTVALVLEAARAVGAPVAAQASWLTALCLAMAVSSAILSWRHRLPIITAWSTPGAALIAAGAGAVTLPQAVGAFLLVAGLIVLTGALPFLSRLVERLPAALAAAMLAGVLLPFVLRLVQAAVAEPAFLVPILALFLVARLASPALAVVALVLAGIVLALVLGRVGGVEAPLEPGRLVLVWPEFAPAVLLGLGLPLYLVTMAGQNLPGFAVLKGGGYTVPSRAILVVTGLVSAATALAGAHTSNLAAITAAICTGSDTHPDPARRWPAGLWYAGAYLVLAVTGTALVALFAALPPTLIAAIAGAALLGPLAGALATALGDPDRRMPAVVTFAVSAAGIAPLGIGAAFWGLGAGLLVLALESAWARWRR